MIRPQPFELSLVGGGCGRFPSERPTLLCFAKSDCPTCSLVSPILDRIARHIDVRVIAQDPDGGAALRERLDVRVGVFDDSDLGVSYAWGVETVPTALAATGNGGALGHAEGFVRSEWAELVRTLFKSAGLPEPSLDWGALPAARPGCGSRTLEPGTAERLAARSAAGPLRSRRVEIPAGADPYEFLFEQGVTDGLPVVPPTPERVLRMLTGTRRDPDDVVAVVPPNLAPVTVEKAAINAVMAGCAPEHLPVVLAALEAVCREEFNLHGVLATTYFASPVLVVNGPIRNRIGINSGLNCLGQGSRANSTIGRAVQLVVRNVGGGRPGEVDRATFGQPGKYGLCFGENEERSDWSPLHVERGLDPEESAVTVYACGAPTGFIDQLARDGRALATSYGLALAAVGHPKHPFQGDVLVLVPPEHVDTFRRDGWTKERVREQILRATERPLREWARDDLCAEGVPPALVERLGPETPVSKFPGPESIHLVVAGGEAGKFGVYLQGWVPGHIGSIPVTRAIEE